jgi:hypothetical protein
MVGPKAAGLTKDNEMKTPLREIALYSNSPRLKRDLLTANRKWRSPKNADPICQGNIIFISDLA